MSELHITILNQLTHFSGNKGNAYGRLVAMIGATGLVAFGNSISFRFKMCKKFNHVQIKLMSNDLYQVTFKKFWGQNELNITVIHDVYCDRLKSLFEDQTGLYVQL